MGIFDKAVSIGKAALNVDRTIAGVTNGFIGKLLPDAIEKPLGQMSQKINEFVGGKLQQGVDHVKTHGKEYLDDPSKLKGDLEGLPGFDKVKNVAHKAWDFIPEGVKTAAAGAVAGPAGVAAVKVADVAGDALTPSNTGPIPASPEGIAH